MGTVCDFVNVCLPSAHVHEVQSCTQSMVVRAGSAADRSGSWIAHWCCRCCHHSNGKHGDVVRIALVKLSFRLLVVGSFIGNTGNTVGKVLFVADSAYLKS